MRRFVLFPLLVFFAASCQSRDSIAPIPDADFAKGGNPPDCGVDPAHPKCKKGDGEGATATVELCAKKSVVDAINGIDEANDPEPWLPWLESGSTTTDCECGPWPEYCPTGTLTYSTAGPVFEWKFNGSGFLPIDHRYVLIYFPDPWPGRQLICLEEDVIANRGGKIRFSGSRDLGQDLEDAKIWIVRRHWVDCEGGGFEHWDHGEGVPRLTNNQEPALDPDPPGTWEADATETCTIPFATPPYPCEDAKKVYDWLFETALIQYDDTDAQ